MARKTKEGAEATREEIVNAAELCFLEEGVFRTTLEHIAKRAGYTRGAVYWHFKNKLEVLEAVMDRVELPIFTGLEQMVEEAAGEWPLRSLRRFYKDAFEQFARDPHVRNAVAITLLRCEFVEETRPIFDRQQRRAAEAHSRVTQVFRRAQKLRQLREGLSPPTCALALRFVIVGSLREWLLNPDAVCLQRDGLAAIDAMLASFAVEGALKEEKKAPALHGPSRSANQH